MQPGLQDSRSRFNAAGWTWVQRGLLLLFAVSALLGWVQLKRTRVLYYPVVPAKSDWGRPEPVHVDHAPPGTWQTQLLGMPGRSHGPGESAPSLRVALPYRPLGYVLHVGIDQSDRRPARIEATVNGVFLGQHATRHSLELDTVEFTVPSGVLRKDQTHWLMLRNRGNGAWVGRLLLIPYGSLRKPLQVVLPVIGFFLLLLGALRRQGRATRLQPVWIAVVFFFIYFHTCLTAKVFPLAGLAFSDGDELVRPFLTNVMEYDLTKHMLCLPVIHLLWRAFSLMGWAAMVALSGAFAVVAAANAAVAYLVFSRLVRHGLGAMLLTLCYAGSFSIWLYSSIFETFIFSSLLANLFLLAWFSSRGIPSLGRACFNAVMVVLCGLAHPPLLVFLGAVIHEWLRMWRKRNLAMTLAGAVLLVLVTCGGFLGGRFVMRRAYIADSEELATGSVVEEYADAGKMIELYASADNMTWDNVGNMVMGQCVYAVGGREPTFDWSRGWSSARAYLGRPTGWLMVAGIALLWGLAGRGIVLRPGKLLETGALAALVVLPTMLFYLWFNPGEMLLYSPPMMAVMLGWLAWAGRPGAPRVFDGAVAVLAWVVVCVNTMAIMSFL